LTRGRTIVVDGLIFQMQRGRPHGISRMWDALLRAAGRLPLGGDLLLLDRDRSAPDIPGIRRRAAPPFSLRELEAQADILDAVCREEGAGLFLSTYYSFTRATPSLLMLYDMILELFFTAESSGGEGADIGRLVRRLELEAKRAAVRLAKGFMAISSSTAADLGRCYPESRGKPVAVVPCGVSEEFRPHPYAALAGFRRRHGIRRPYFLLVGSRGHYKNARLFMEAFAALPEREAFEILMAGGEARLDPASQKLLGRTPWRIRFLSDAELSLAYAGATALVYPSRYEGFGLPLLEAMAAGCPVIACPVSSVPEVAGDAALYVDPDDAAGMVKALTAVMRPEVRGELVRRGRERAGRFSWERSAAAFAAAVAAMRPRPEEGPGAAAVAWPSAAQPPPPAAPPATAGGDPPVKVSAIVATFNAESFIRGCLQDLVDQTLFAAGGLEVIVVDGGSSQRERAIVREFQARHPRIRYLPAQGHETVTRSWNRGIAAARGDYLTTANTDDRHRRDALERLAAALDAHPEAALAYADLLKTETPNAAFDAGCATGRFRWPDWSRATLLSRGCFMGPQPMWRRSVHACFGGFDETLVSSGDFEFWLRISQAFDFLHIPEPLGLYLVRAESLERRDPGRKAAEDREIFARYREAAAAGELVRCLPLEELRQAARKGTDPGVNRRRELAARIDRLAQAAARRGGGAGGEAERRRYEALRERILTEELSLPLVEAFAAAAAKTMLAGRGLSPGGGSKARAADPAASGAGADARRLLDPPELFHAPGEVEAYAEAFAELTAAIHAGVHAPRPSDDLRRLAERYADRASFIPLYFSRRSLKALAIERAAIAQAVLRARGQELPPFAAAPRAGRPRIRLGVHCRSLGPSTEMRAALPVFRDLDPGRFEVFLYTHAPDDGPLAAAAKARADRLIVLPPTVKASAARIRADDLDLLFFANNLTAVTNLSTRLADYRLAPFQFVHFANPTTTGKRHIDGFLLGSLIAARAEVRSEFTEALLTIEGSGICFAEGPAAAGGGEGSRAALGLPAAGTLFLSGANATKLIPELRRAWAEILRQVPDASLVLYPFGPAWAAEYPREALEADLRRVFAAQGIAADRLIVRGPLPGPQAVRALNLAADVYLDAVPYSGATSLLDPLAAGLPPVVCDGGTLRFGQGAAMLRELGVPELVAGDEAGYIRLAVRLGRDPARRGALRARVRERMAAGPAFLDPGRHARRVAAALERLPAAGGRPARGACCAAPKARAAAGDPGAICA
jgi:predicted O-linked N-acetylglucosamine transferase (SPINDLY family)/glycosyltransferase involved in cell wall biosynthesis